MATRLPLPARYAIRFARDGSWRPEPLPGTGDEERQETDPGAFPGEAAPILRVAATIAAIALGGFAVVFVALLALVGVP